MQIIYRGFAAGLLAAGLAMGAPAMAAQSPVSYDGHWRGTAYLECTGISASMEFVIREGDMNGEILVRGQG